MNEKMILRKDKAVKAIVQSMIAVFGISFLKGENSCWLFLVFGLLTALFYWIEICAKEVLVTSGYRGKRFLGTMIVCSGILTVFCILGWCISTVGALNELYKSWFHLLKAFLGIAGYFILISRFLYVIFYMEAAVNSHRLFWAEHKGKEPSGILQKLKQLTVRYVRRLRSKPFWTSFFTILILYVPYILVSYPGIFMSDSVSIVAQGWGFADFTSHHPVFYQLILNTCMKAGVKIFHSWNIGLFLYSMLQMLFVISVLSCGIHILLCYTKIRVRYVMALMLYFVVQPRIVNYMFLATKDVFYAAFILLWIEMLFLIKKNGWKAAYGVAYGVSLLCSILIRNDGFYVVGISLLIFCFLDRASWKKHALCLFLVIAAQVLFSSVIFPGLGAKSGSKREMLSIPIQQVARTVWKHPEHITREEEQVILNACDFESLEEIGASYDSNISDNIKDYFVWDAFSTEAKEFYKVWLHLGLKHPVTYIEAFIANYYHYFYPGEKFANYSYGWSQDCFAYTNEHFGSDLHYGSAASGPRKALEDLRETIFGIQPLSVLNIPGIFTWIFVIFIAFICISAKGSGDVRWMMITPGIIILLVCFASPMNGYYGRYQFPLVMSLPWMILAGYDQVYCSKQ